MEQRFRIKKVLYIFAIVITALFYGLSLFHCTAMRTWDMPLLLNSEFLSTVRNTAWDMRRFYWGEF